MSVRILEGDVRAVLPTLAVGSVHCVVTSPPYWGLRDYGVAGQFRKREGVSPAAWRERGQAAGARARGRGRISVGREVAA